MKFEQLTIGETYYTEFFAEFFAGEFCIIIMRLYEYPKMRAGLSSRAVLLPHLKKYLTTVDNHGEIENNWRIATEQEREWLNQCIEANKYIPFEQINSLHLIHN